MKSKKVVVVVWSKKLRRSIAKKTYELGWNEDTNEQDQMTYQDLIYRHKDKLDKEWRKRLGEEKFDDLKISFKSEHRAGEKDVQEYQGDPVMKKEAKEKLELKVKDEMRGYQLTGKEALRDFTEQLSISVHDYGYEYFPVEENGKEYIGSREINSAGDLLSIYLKNQKSTADTASLDVVYTTNYKGNKEEHLFKHIEINCKEAGNRDILEFATTIASKLRELGVKVRRTITNKIEAKAHDSDEESDHNIYISGRGVKNFPNKETVEFAKNAVIHYLKNIGINGSFDNEIRHYEKDYLKFTGTINYNPEDKNSIIVVYFYLATNLSAAEASCYDINAKKLFSWHCGFGDNWSDIIKEVVDTLTEFLKSTDAYNYVNENEKIAKEGSEIHDSQYLRTANKYLKLNHYEITDELYNEIIYKSLYRRLGIKEGQIIGRENGFPIILYPFHTFDGGYNGKIIARMVVSRNTSLYNTPYFKSIMTISDQNGRSARAESGFLYHPAKAIEECANKLYEKAEDAEFIYDLVSPLPEEDDDTELSSESIHDSHIDSIEEYCELKLKDLGIFGIDCWVERNGTSANYQFSGILNKNINDKVKHNVTIIFNEYPERTSYQNNTTEQRYKGTIWIDPKDRFELFVHSSKVCKDYKECIDDLVNATKYFLDQNTVPENISEDTRIEKIMKNNVHDSAEYVGEHTPDAPKAMMKKELAKYFDVLDDGTYIDDETNYQKIKYKINYSLPVDPNNKYSGDITAKIVFMSGVEQQFYAVTLYMIGDNNLKLKSDEKLSYYLKDVIEIAVKDLHDNFEIKFEDLKYVPEWSRRHSESYENRPNVDPFSWDKEELKERFKPMEESQVHDSDNPDVDYAKQQLSKVTKVNTGYIKHTPSKSLFGDKEDMFDCEVYSPKGAQTYNVYLHIEHDEQLDKYNTYVDIKERYHHTGPVTYYPFNNRTSYKEAVDDGIKEIERFLLDPRNYKTLEEIRKEKVVAGNDYSKFEVPEDDEISSFDPYKEFGINDSLPLTCADYKSKYYCVEFSLAKFDPKDRDFAWYDTQIHPVDFDTKEEALAYIDSINEANCPYGNKGDSVTVDLVHEGHREETKVFVKDSKVIKKKK